METLMVRIDERQLGEWVPVAYVRVTENDLIQFTGEWQPVRFVFLPHDIDYSAQPLRRAHVAYKKGNLG